MHYSFKGRAVVRQESGVQRGPVMFQMNSRSGGTWFTFAHESTSEKQERQSIECFSSSCILTVCFSRASVLRGLSVKQLLELSTLNKCDLKLSQAHIQY